MLQTVSRIPFSYTSFLSRCLAFGNLVWASVPIQSSHTDKVKQSYIVRLKYPTDHPTPILHFGAVRTGLEGAGLSKLQKILYCFFIVGGRYAWARLQLVSAFQRWGDRQRV